MTSSAGTAGSRRRGAVRGAVWGRVAVMAWAMGGCAPTLPPDALQDLDRVRQAPATRQAATWAPPAYQHAEQLRRSAREAFDEGELATAQILAEQAHAAYAKAVALARLARAEREGAEAQHDVERAEAKLAELDAQHQRVTADIAALEQRLEVLRDAEPIVPSDAASGAREKARWESVAALRLQGRLLCTAATLLAEDGDRGAGPSATPPGAADALVQARAALSDFEQLLASEPAVAPIDHAMRVRAACLGALTAARRGGAAAAAEPLSSADGLLQRLSEGGVEAPLRDDRGVVVTLRGAFDGDGLSEAGRRALAPLAVLAAEIPSVPIMVVVHHADSPAGPRAPRWQRRAAALVRALSRPHAAIEHAGPALPAVPRRGKYAARNERVEIVFVTPHLL